MPISSQTVRRNPDDPKILPDVPVMVAPPTDGGLGHVLSFQWSANSQTMAETARIAGRMNAANVSEEEHDALLAERQGLLDKHFAGTLSRKESNRLEYVRWSLDRIEDAKHGASLDALEGHIQRYEQFLSDLDGLKSRLKNAASARR